MLASMTTSVQWATSPKTQILLGLGGITDVHDRAVFTWASVSDVKKNDLIQDAAWEEEYRNIETVESKNSWGNKTTKIDRWQVAKKINKRNLIYETLTLSQSLVGELNKFMVFSDNNEKNSIYHPIYVKSVGRKEGTGGIQRHEGEKKILIKILMVVFSR